MSPDDSLVNAYVLRTIHWCHVASLVGVDAPNCDSSYLTLLFGAANMYEVAPHSFRLTGLTATFLWGDTFKIWFLWEILRGNICNSKQTGSWTILSKDGDYQSGKWKHTYQEDNQSHLLAQSHIPIHAAMSGSCLLDMKEPLNGSNFLEQQQPALDIYIRCLFLKILSEL